MRPSRAGPRRRYGRVAGGVGTLYGAFVGAAIYLTIQTYLSSYTDRWQLLVGLIFVLTVLLMPQGVVAGVRAAFARLSRKNGGA